MGLSLLACVAGVRKGWGREVGREATHEGGGERSDGRKYVSCSQASHHETVAKMFMTVLWPLVFISLFTILTPVLICPFSRFSDEVVLRTHPIKMRGSIAFLCCLAVASGFVLKFDDEVQWQAWKSFHSKAYSTESEEAARKAIWRDNLGVRNGSFCEIPL